MWYHQFLFFKPNCYYIGFQKGGQTRAVELTKEEWNSYESFFERQMAARLFIKVDCSWETCGVRDPYE